MRLSHLTPAALLLLLATPASSGVLFFTNDPGGFDAARGSTTLAGSEDWESSTLNSNMIATLADPLEPGVMKSPFPNGTNTATGMTVQSNTLGGSPSMTSPGGGLVTASDGLSGTPTDQLSNNTNGNSFDMIFGLAETTAVSFTPLIFDSDASGDAGTATIRVYDGSNTLLGTATDVPVAGFVNPTTVTGVVATDGDVIGRINIFATSSGDDFSGADNINVYTGTVPVELMNFRIE